MLNRLEIKSAERIKRGNKISEETLEARIGSLRSCFQEFNCKNINLDRYSAPKKKQPMNPAAHIHFSRLGAALGDRDLWGISESIVGTLSAAAKSFLIREPIP